MINPHDGALPPDSSEIPGADLPMSSPDYAEQAVADMSDNVVPTFAFNSLPVVGLGGSAGSLKPLQDFFTSIPSETGMVFVVIVHLSPEHESIMAEILQRCTTMPIIQVTENARVKVNHVYVIPPRKHLSMMDGQIALTELERERGRHVTVDLFFRTLADTHGPHAIAVVLSGTDADGSIGIKRIKERGGLTIVQDPQEAEHGGMPRSALETGMVDFILPAKAIAARIVEFQNNSARLNLPSENITRAAPAGHEKSADEAALRDILVLLRTRTGRDFIAYKRATILRRIARRMQVNSVENLTAYHGLLRNNPGEAGALLQDLLISVTNFFRDREAFMALENELPEVFKGKSTGDVIRVWVPACATGEEAYSIAMMLTEHAAKLDAPPQLQIFATDIDEDAVAVARAGIYSAAIVADINEERLHQFFSKHHGHFRVSQTLREIVMFAVHDFLKDPPFSRLDLVSCRNVLIYLNREAQNRVFDVFHFSLLNEGMLFLGASETAEDASSRFSIIDKKHRIYRRRNVIRTGLPITSGPLSVSLAVHTHQRLLDRVILPRLPAVASEQTALQPPDSKTLQPADLHFKLIERFASPSLVVDRESNIVHLSASVGRYLHLGGGTPSANLLNLVHPMLRVELRAALFRAAQTDAPAEAKDVQVELGGSKYLINIAVYPAPDLAPDYLLVVLEERAEHAQSLQHRTTAETEGVAKSLERELELTKHQLRTTMEQYGASIEEMKASNEELQAMNEELRSASEELETSREELQSINEELTTVNAELKSKLEELARANSDLQNLMGASNIATVFLDRDLRIKRYTPSSVPLFNFIPTDMGRPISDLANRLDFSTIVTDAEKVLREVVPIEREVRDSAGNWFMARLTPYLSRENHIGGVVLAFVDITQRKIAEDTVRSSEARFRALVSQNAAGICGSDLLGNITFVNPKLCELLGWTEHELIGKKFDTVDSSSSSLGNVIAEQISGSRPPFQNERRLLRKGGSYLWADVSVAVIRDEQGRPTSAVAAIVDTNERKQTEEALRASRQSLAAIFAQAAVGLSELSLDGQFVRVNEGLCRLLNRSREELLTCTVPDVTHPDDLPTALAALEKLKRTGTPQSVDKRHVRPDGSTIWVNTLLTRLDDDTGAPRTILAVTADLTDRKQAEQELRRTGEELELRVVARTAELDKLNKALRVQITERIAAELSRQDMMRQLVTAQEEERGRISRELHDEVGQHLTALMLGLKELQSGKAENPENLLKMLQAITEKVGKEIHDLATEIRPTSLDDLGLFRTLTNYFNEWSGRAKVPLDFHATDWPDVRLPSHIETTLYRIICEALNNILKHARASRVSIILNQRAGQAVAIIEDDGVGFDSQGAQTNSSRKALGIVGMKERVVLVDGELNIESKPGKGTTVFVRIPLPPKT